MATQVGLFIFYNSKKQTCVATGYRLAIFYHLRHPFYLFGMSACHSSILGFLLSILLSKVKQMLEEDALNVLKFMASNQLVANPSKTALSQAYPYIQRRKT